jgi:hypothetical protein
MVPDLTVFRGEQADLSNVGGTEKHVGEDAHELVRKRLNDLQRGSGGRRMLSDVEVNDPPTVMEKDNEDEQDSSRSQWRSWRRLTVRLNTANC